MPAIHTGAMYMSAFKLGRRLRIVLLLMLLASQAVASAHALGDAHDLHSGTCAACLLGHGLDYAVGATHEPPAVQVSGAVVVVQAIILAHATCATAHPARAPPGHSW